MGLPHSLHEHEATTLADQPFADWLIDKLRTRPSPESVLVATADENSAQSLAATVETHTREVTSASGDLDDLPLDGDRVEVSVVTLGRRGIYQRHPPLYEACRVTKPSGTIVLGTPNYLPETDHATLDKITLFQSLKVDREAEEDTTGVWTTVPYLASTFTVTKSACTAHNSAIGEQDRRSLADFSQTGQGD